MLAPGSGVSLAFSLRALKVSAYPCIIGTKLGKLVVMKLASAGPSMAMIMLGRLLRELFW